MLSDTKSALLQLGYHFEKKSGLPRVDLDKEFVSSINKNISRSLAAKENKHDTDTFAVTVHALGNFTKDSLYVELCEAAFIELRERCNVGSSEMEFSALVRLAQQMNKKQSRSALKVGLVVLVLASIPGDAAWVMSGNKKQVIQNRLCFGVFETYREIAAKHRERELR